MVKNENFYLAPCIYGADEKHAVLSALLDEVFEENAAQVSNNGEQLWDVAELKHCTPDTKILRPQGGNLGAYLHRYAPILKDPAFAEEREWRRIPPAYMLRNRDGYRAGRSMITPHYRTPLSAQDNPMKIDEIVVGPTPHIQQSRRSVISLLVSLD